MTDGRLETAAEMAIALRAGEVTSSELVERALGRAESWQPSINAFSQIWAEEATREASRIDHLPFGERGPWAGVPVAVKDLFDVAGHETTGCCLAYRGTVAAADAPVIERVRAAGLVMIGKTNQHELAAGGTNLVSACGRTGNPWDPSRMTGGSSGGSAAAVAARVVPWALGSDTGGSIRIPSAMCGTFGLKPTYGALPLAGLMPLAPSMDCPGPIAGTAHDLGLLYELMGGSGSASEAPFRIGVPGGFFTDHAQDQVLDVMRATADVFRGGGLRVDEIDATGIDNVRRVWIRACFLEFARAHPLLKDPERRRLVAPSVVEWLEIGETLTQGDRAETARDREKVGRWFRERLEKFDALLIPTTPYPAPRADQERVDLGAGGVVEVIKIGPGWMTSSVNLSGLPAISIPAGRSSEGLPIGASLVGRDREEGTLLALASSWERAAGYTPRAPK